ncbi:MAG: hypothetical protein GY754_24610 [bacterium]|nr:hypothetical protein [bacterium]
MKLNVYGKKIEIMKSGENWVVFYPGSEGKKRIADDIVIPPNIQQDELIEYIADLCHEWARPGFDRVYEI